MTPPIELTDLVAQAAAVKKKKKKKKKQTVKCRTVTVKVRGKKVKRRVCKPVKKKPQKLPPGCKIVTRKLRGKKVKVRVCTPVKKPVTPVFTPTPLPAPAPTPYNPPPQPPPPLDVIPSDEPLEPFTGALTRRQAERLLWRAGFGPRADDLATFTGLSAQDAATRLLDGVAAPSYSGSAPTIDAIPLGNPYTWIVGSQYGFPHLQWLDRMVRTTTPLHERLALVFHDWFATRAGAMPNVQPVMRQINTMRSLFSNPQNQGFGTFDQLLQAMTVDQAMLSWQDGSQNSKTSPNENYARELMELFSLGGTRPDGTRPYSEGDVREAARALTGWLGDPLEAAEFAIYYDPNRHDTGAKTMFGAPPSTTEYEWADFTSPDPLHPERSNPTRSRLVDAVLANSAHAPFFCAKLWSYFIPTPPDQATLSSLVGTYLAGARRIRPVLEQILTSAAFYTSATMTVPPIVFAAGAIRATGATVANKAWIYYCDLAGQLLYSPPNVAGWDDTRWLDTGTWRGRWLVAREALRARKVDPADGWYADEPPDDAVANALHRVGNPTISNLARYRLRQFAERTSALGQPNAANLHAQRLNALMMLILTSPDRNVC